MYPNGTKYRKQNKKKNLYKTITKGTIHLLEQQLI